MIPMYTAEQVRDAEAARMREVPAGSLMQQASYGLAQVVLRLLRASGGVYGRRVVLLVGPGGNGGDALYAGVTLLRRGVGVEAVLLRSQTYPGALPAFLASGGTIGPQDEAASAIDDAHVVIDGIAGLGSSRDVGLAEPLRVALARHRCIVAADVPSGVVPDSGRAAADAIAAHTTVTFGCFKTAHFLAPAANHCGTVELIDIGLAPHLSEPAAHVLSADDVYGSWPRQAYNGDKYALGVVAIAAGSSTYPGAAVLSVGGALRAKAGMVRYAGEASEPVLAAWPEAVACSAIADAGRAQAWIVGPGLGTDERAEQAVRDVLALDVTALVDADAITVLARNPELLDGRTAPTVLTPHAGEFRRLFGDIDDPLSAAQRAAEKSGAVVLLKGPTTVIAAAGQTPFVNPTGTPQLATAGSGDVLAGIAGALLAAGIEPQRAAAMAAYAHGEAAASAPYSVLASDLPGLLRDRLEGQQCNR
ncbi:NAD(P)H-hydrate dehydratase [Cumulibacter soli]|uniref:NAD(P)H-hydrate dehydratase n=1 Tax=Cumulibacter soli TaxID=2546344 RepID=UPI00106750BE|nr:NAD(P)H-hydrate dehydratase [Cumulibacter soli]